VQQAYFSSKGNDFNTWMGAFEKRVNEIYDGEGIVSIAADRKNNRLDVTGYVDKNAQAGFQAGDDKLFAIEQTGDAVNDQVPIRVSNGGGATYYEGHHSLLDNPFLQAMLISHMFGGWGGRYYTPPTRVVYLNNYRRDFRQTPRYSVQKTANKSFATRFKQDQAGKVESRRTFSGGDSGTKRRSWTGGGNATTGTDATETHPRRTWGGRRSSSGSSSSGSTRRSWGGRRR
jgi:hypothetical protein